MVRRFDRVHHVEEVVARGQSLPRRVRHGRIPIQLIRQPQERCLERVPARGIGAFGDPANSFHEKAALCRAAENTCYFASVNCASAGSPTTSAVVRPDGTLLNFQPYGKEGLLIVDIDLSAATGLLAARCKSA